MVGNMNRMQVYRLVGVDPEPVIKTLEQMGNLDPTTRLEIDKKSKAIIAYASLADHVTIRALVDKLSGSERSFEVRRLRRLPADYVAGTIAFMLGVQPKKQKERSSPWFFREPEQQKPTERPNEFRVDADLEHNRLLLWANEVELAEVEQAVGQAGRNSRRQRDGADGTARMNVGNPEETEELLERIRRAWPTGSAESARLADGEAKERQARGTAFAGEAGRRASTVEDYCPPIGRSGVHAGRFADQPQGGQSIFVDHRFAAVPREKSGQSPPRRKLGQSPTRKSGQSPLRRQPKVSRKRHRPSQSASSMEDWSSHRTTRRPWIGWRSCWASSIRYARRTSSFT